MFLLLLLLLLTHFVDPSRASHYPLNSALVFPYERMVVEIFYSLRKLGWCPFLPIIEEKRRLGRTVKCVKTTSTKIRITVTLASGKCIKNQSFWFIPPLDFVILDFVMFTFFIYSIIYRFYHLVKLHLKPRLRGRMFSGYKPCKYKLSRMME